MEPQIPQNTGSIARSCAATRTPLHLVGDKGFHITEKNVRRAGLDYWPYVQLSEHANWENFHASLSQTPPPRLWFFTKFATRHYFDVAFAPGDYLVFGNETKGLGEEFLDRQAPEHLLSIPMFCEGVRSLNLSNAVSIALFEGIRQLLVRCSSGEKSSGKDKQT